MDERHLRHGRFVDIETLDIDKRPQHLARLMEAARRVVLRDPDVSFDEPQEGPDSRAASRSERARRLMLAVL